MALRMEDQHLLYASWVRDTQEGKNEFLRELEKGAPDFPETLRRCLDFYIAHCMRERHFGTHFPNIDQIKSLARIFWDCELWLLAALRAAHGSIPAISPELVEGAMESFNSQEKILERYKRFHIHEGWIHGFLADAHRFHVCGVEFLESDEPFSGCVYGVGMFLALADTFMVAAEKAKSQAVNLQMQETASAFANFINEELGGKLDSLGKKDTEG